MSENNSSGGWKIPLIIGVILGATLLAFAFQNNNLVNVKFLIWEGYAPLSLTYFAVFAFTFIVASLFGIANWIRRGRLKREIKSLKEDLEKLQREKMEFKENEVIENE